MTRWALRKRTDLMMILFVDNVAESKYGKLSWDESVRQNIRYLYFSNWVFTDIGLNLTVTEK